jgi:membrane-associated phospholipid phosphatase
MSSTRPQPLRYRFAHLLTFVLNPLMMPGLLFGLLVAHFGGSTLQVGWFTAVGLVFFCFIPLLHVLWLVRHRKAATVEVRDQHQRTGPFIGSTVAALAAFVVVLLTASPESRLVVALAAFYPFNTLLLLLINLRWKISIHMTGLAGFVGVTLLVAMLWPSPTALVRLAWTGPMLLLVPLLMWARVQVGAHTWGQVTGGTLFGLLVPPAELYAVLRLHLLA